MASMRSVAKVTAYIGIGGNIGDVVANMNKAIRAFGEDPDITLRAVSKVYKTPPWGIKDQDWFLNACFSLETSLSATTLLDKCLEVEKGLKRVRNVRWGPRTIDLDILVYGDETLKTCNLEIPHPRMHERAFVLQPLSDIAPDIEVRGKTISEWLRETEQGDMQTTEHSLILQNW